MSSSEQGRELGNCWEMSGSKGSSPPPPPSSSSSVVTDHASTRGILPTTYKRSRAFF
ncbi:hypothetical protein X777_00424 [Ooceraea biroi]|uniref:Uncharacterized protein n=1 Tax=Ooceraea biroi TaxID=2015173 RepID=A0A026WV99_OOCBI|nr:hypothetical protein X777_00424 [Ooceraea biroi]